MEMKYQPLKELAQIRMGFMPRGRVEVSPGSPVKLLQLRDMQPDCSLDWNSAVPVDLDPKALSRFRAQAGDVLLSSKGEPLRASFLANPPRDALVSAHFFVLTPLMPTLRGDYLALYLCQRVAQSYFHRNMEGTALKQLKLHALEDLPIELPSRSCQEKLAKLYQLHREHKLLTTKLQEKMDLMIANLSAKQMTENL